MCPQPSPPGAGGFGVGKSPDTVAEMPGRNGLPTCSVLLCEEGLGRSRSSEQAVRHSKVISRTSDLNRCDEIRRLTQRGLHARRPHGTLSSKLIVAALLLLSDCAWLPSLPPILSPCFSSFHHNAGTLRRHHGGHKMYVAPMPTHPHPLHLPGR
eukprot:COSAG05_NODE_5061_length_1274_cov_1.695319_1_plen_154_part_00